MRAIVQSNWLWLALIVASLAVRMAHYARAWFRRASGSRVGGMLSVWAWLLCYLLILALTISHLIRDAPSPIWLNLAGWLTLTAGIGIRIWAVRALDAFHTESIMCFQGHRLITHGPYRWIRHPLHWALMMEMAGLAAMSGTQWSLVPIAVSLAVMAGRNRAEEQFLARQFGVAFEEHRRRTWDPLDALLRRP